MSKNSIFSIIAARVPVTLLYPSSFIRDLPRILIRALVIFYNFSKHPASEIGPKTNDKYYFMANVKCKSQALAFPLFMPLYFLMFLFLIKIIFFITNQIFISMISILMISLCDSVIEFVQLTEAVKLVTVNISQQKPCTHAFFIRHLSPTIPRKNVLTATGCT